MKRTKTYILLMLLATVLVACAANMPTAAPATDSSTASKQSTDPANTTKLNLNLVTGDKLLATIPGFNNRMVREFQEYRPYVSIQQFRREIGKYVGDAQVAEWEKYVYVPIWINESDSQTLQQIPGLDATEVESLVTARPYVSADDFLVKLSGFISTDELEIAKTYLGDN